MYMKINKRRILVQIVLAAVLATGSGIGWAQSGITDLGVLNGGSESVAFRISADGKVVVGWARDGAAGNAIRAFRWTQTSGMQSLGVVNGGSRSFALDVNADGSVVVGYATDGATQHKTVAYRWTKASGMRSLGAFPGSVFPDQKNSFAYGVSADGQVVAGYAEGPENGDGYRAFRWTHTIGMKSLGTLNEKAPHAANGRSGWSQGFVISADGTVVVGRATDLTPNTQYPVFRWTQASGMLRLGKLDGNAYGVSVDGKVVAGYTIDDTAGNAIRAFRWTQTTEMQSLGVLNGGSDSRAFGVNADGSVVVGHAADGAAGNANRAFRWTQTTRMQTVENWLRASGVKIAADITKAAYGTNSDGSVVVGQLANGHAFIARSPVQR